MLKYWPTVYYRKNDKIEHLSTSFGYNCADAAVGYVNFCMTEHKLDVTEAKIDVYNNREFLHTISLRVVVNSWGEAVRWQLPKDAVLGVKVV